jgi:hypothetical protein
MRFADTVEIYFPKRLKEIFFPYLYLYKPTACIPQGSKLKYFKVIGNSKKICDELRGANGVDFPKRTKTNLFLLYLYLNKPTECIPQGSIFKYFKVLGNSQKICDEFRRPHGVLLSKKI